MFLHALLLELASPFTIEFAPTNIGKMLALIYIVVKSLKYQVTLRNRLRLLDLHRITYIKAVSRRNPERNCQEVLANDEDIMTNS
jgi:hypothetical protein